MDLQTPALTTLLDNWLNEDLGRGDLTNVLFDNQIGSANWIAKQKGVFCSGPIVTKLFQRLNKLVEVQLLVAEGETFDKGQVILNVFGPRKALLSGERTSLNLAMHLSGITTATAKLVKELEGTNIKLVDTRKTTPGLRTLEKYAVRCGGGINHRMGLDDAVMLKENHLAWSKNIQQSIKILRQSIPWSTKIIVEAETADEAKEAVHAGADAILLDEMSPVEISQIVPQLRAMAEKSAQDRHSNQIIIEVSGINPLKLKEYASTGIDLISTSAPITQSNWIDFSMRFTEPSRPEK